LTTLELSFNIFSGSIPPGIGNCSILRVLRAGSNNLGGTLPDELFNATSLEHLSFPNNNLHGVLDSARIINLRNLITIDLGGNNFSGNIPNSISELESLEKLRLDNNNFSGELSKVNFSNLSNLKVLDLWLNNFTGTVPESIYSCSNLTALRLSSNYLHGQLSSSIGNIKYLSFLSLGKNNFTNITSALHILKSSKNLTTLFIGHNFRGELMPEDDIIDGFENLQVLSFEYCELLGRIPLWISRLTNLEMLILNGNQLTGPITTRKKPIVGGNRYRRTTKDVRRWSLLPAHLIVAAPAMKAFCRRTSVVGSPALFPGMASADSGQAQESLPAHQPRGAPAENALLPAHPWAGAPAMILGPGPGVI
jgi:Leucine-rich repeat (LRR) protein